MTYIADQFLHLIEPKKEFHFPESELNLTDHGPLIGTGELIVFADDSGNFRFKMPLKHLNRNNLYSGVMNVDYYLYDQARWPRLDAIDVNGRSWTGGYVSPLLKDEGSNLGRLEGEFVGLSTSLTRTAHEVGHVEMVIPVGHLPNVPGTLNILLDDTPFKLELDGTTAWFSYDSEKYLLKISALYSEECKQPYLDGWLCEPLRILIGSPLHPQIWVRVAQDNTWKTQVRVNGPDLRDRWSAWWGMWRSHDTPFDKTTFWEWYKSLFAYISAWRNNDGGPQFQENPLTRFYTEIEEASLSTNWILALAHCSALEGLVNTLSPDNKIALSVEQDQAVDNFKAHIKAWKGVSGHKLTADESNMRDVAISNLLRIRSATTSRKLRALVSHGTLTKQQVKAWNAVRNRVMHGNLTEAYSTAEGDGNIRFMSDAIFAVTKAICGIPPTTIESIQWSKAFENRK